ncbi:Aminotransferase-like mobile domain containing protein [Trema orientale]|uniref:Aminotransferase-like mobile domain containing protein n=1 Tax=Trema orientale TaxID=63057 RepID=A0A2P5A790_TREOI|nr:Aminotransferase-like mobile domain containing protein [Trema orientale]
MGSDSSIDSCNIEVFPNSSMPNRSENPAFDYWDGPLTQLPYDPLGYINDLGAKLVEFGQKLSTLSDKYQELEKRHSQLQVRNGDLFDSQMTMISRMHESEREASTRIKFYEEENARLRKALDDIIEEAANQHKEHLNYRASHSLASPVAPKQTRNITPSEYFASRKDIINWYNELPLPVRNKVDAAEFRPLLSTQPITNLDGSLIQALAEKWWDTTHSFHFEHMGEMTLTPKDFSALTGLAVAGSPIRIDMNAHRRNADIVKYFGPAFRSVICRSVRVKWICETYRNQQCSNNEEEDILVRVFTLALIGSTIFSRSNGRQQLDDLCCGNIQIIGGLAYALEVLWSPWGDDASLPKYVSMSLPASESRILLLGPDGGQWYLAERVSMQSLGEQSFLIPKIPLRSMLVQEKLSFVNEKWAVHGKHGYNFIDDFSALTYEQYREMMFTRTTCEPENISSTENTSGAGDEDVFPLPPWTLLLPTEVGGQNIIAIPTDKGIENLQIPPHLKQVSIFTAKRLLRMIAGMQHVLVEHLISARETLNDYTETIENLRAELIQRGNPDPQARLIDPENNEADNVPNIEADNETNETTGNGDTGDVDSDW